MNVNKWIDDLIANKKKKGFPVLSFPAIQKMGITVDQLVHSSDLQAQAMKIVADETPDALASVSMMDLSLEAEAFGSETRFSDSEIPTIIGRIIETEEDADALQIPKIGAGRTQIYIDAIRKAKELITDRPVFAGTIGPFSLAGRLMDVSEIMVQCYEDPGLVHKVLEKTSAFLIEYITAYRLAGADGVLMAEPLAGLLSPDLSEEFSSDYVMKIVAATQTDEFMIAYHNCGKATVRQTDAINSLGCRAVHFGNAIEMADILPKINSDIVVMGNVDPAGQFRNGTPESVRKCTLGILEKCSKYPNFVISSGCDIPPASSWENIHAFFDAVNDFYGK